MLENKKNALRICLSLTLLAIAGYYCFFIISSYMDLDAYVPDEANIAIIVFNANKDIGNSFFNLFKLPNEYAYGSLFWIINVVFSKFAYLRFLNVLFLFSVPCFLFLAAINFSRTKLREFEGATNCLYVVALWLSFPISWFSGKITGPELMALFFGAIGIFFLSSRKFALFAFFSGIAVAIKLNLLILVAYGALFYWFRREEGDQPLRTLPRMLLFLLIGFIAGNPYILYSFSGFMSQISEHLGAKGHLATRFDLSESVRIALFNDSWAWDSVYDGGFFNVVFKWPVFLLFVAFLAFGRKSQRISLYPFLLSLAFSFLILIRASTLSWYWFPVALFMAFEFGRTDFRKVNHLLPIVLILISFATNYGVISKQIVMRQEFMQNVKLKDATNNLVQNKLVELNLKFSRLIDCSELENGFSQDNVVALKEFKLLKGPCLILLGDRISRSHDFGYLVDAAKRNELKLSFLGKCNYVNILYLNE